ncbi:transcription antiterminator [Haloimpatiens sp. FM7315]|uniref:BglG family transcription antiterminator n=1 Tax=Haloimpatiens sp. FM7315 TaxID=3298609 RepID=UPI0035A31E47
MNLNKRCIEILQYMRQKENFIKITDLSLKYNVTDRTIRYDIDKIEKFLVKNNFKYLERHHIKGVKLVREKGLDNFIDKFVNTDTPFKYDFSKEERTRYIVIKLLQSNNPIKVDDFENVLCISRNTILKGLDYIGKWLEEKDLKLIRKPKIGIYVEGSELNKRKAIIEIASQTISTFDIFNYMDCKIAKSKINNLQFKMLFSDIDIDFLNGLIRNSELELCKEFSDEAYGNLITHLSIMIKRIQLNKNIYLPGYNLKEISKYKEYKVAKDIVSKIESKYNIDVPKEEIHYITFHLLGAKVINNSKIMDMDDFKYNDLNETAKLMTEEIEKIYRVDFKEDKTKIIESLVLHLRPSIYRIKFGLKLVNPVFDELIKKYKELFLNAKYVSRHLEEYMGCKINDQEISYITLHFAAALENVNKNVYKAARIVLVCGTGIGTANMLVSQISKKFNVNIVNTVSYRAVKDIDKSTYDLIISTVDINDMKNESYIKINPLLLTKDYEKLKKYLQLRYQPRDENDYLVNKIIEIVKNNAEIKDEQQLQLELMYELKKDRNNIFERGDIYMLCDLLKNDMVKLNVECSTWKDAIKAGASLLNEKGYIDNSYEEAILNNFEKMGPYMVVAPGIVLSHARPECGVNTLSMSLVTLKNPVKFGSETNDPVKLIITLAAVDNDTHLKALSQLMELFMNNEDLQSILKSTTKEEVLKIIKKYSKK